MNSQATSDWNLMDEPNRASFPAVANAAASRDDREPAPPMHRRARFMRGVIAVGLALGGLIMLAMRVRRRTR